MNKRSAGIALLCIAAAIIGSGLTSWNQELFETMLDTVGNGPLVLSWIAFIMGVIYLALAEFESLIKRTAREMKITGMRIIQSPSSRNTNAGEVVQRYRWT
ncbi:hypothetical protein PATA110616_20785 [Paenibacillus tarimensis]